MGFQGDVAGIGLGELLQGLARGGRDGVLTLNSETRTACLGLQAGQLYILASEDEDPDEWRRRSANAWAADPNPNMDTSRRETIARAARLELVYRMLQAPNLHFRFEQGPLPLPPGRSDATPADRPWGKGTTVEFFLLEHARIADECSNGVGATLTPWDLVRALDPASQPLEVRDFLAQCDGSSTLQEIADRLGWPLSQCQLTVGEHIAAETVRVARSREQLAAALHEAQLEQPARAAARLTGWLEASPAGPLGHDELSTLLGEWEAGRLQALLGHLEASRARALLRRMDASQSVPAAAAERWSVLREAQRGDELIELHESLLRLVSEESPDARTFHDLLRLARTFHDRGQDGRTRTLLHLAASHLPSRPQTRVELGKRMLETGLIEEGTRWLLDTARELNDAGRGERAIVPIRIVLRLLPDHVEANELLIETRELQVKRRRRRAGVIAASCVGVLLSLTAFVKFRAHRRLEGGLREVEALEADPDEALRRIVQLFGAEPPPPVAELRDRLTVLKGERDRELLQAWNHTYDAIETACTEGNPIEGLQGALALGDKPPSEGSGRTRADLFGLLSARLGRLSHELDFPVTASIEECEEESRFIDLLRTMLERIDPNEKRAEVSSFRYRVAELMTDVSHRHEKRAVEREELEAAALQRDQNGLLAKARTHDKAGDLERAVEAYDRLLELDPSLGDVPELRKEIDTVRTHRDALRRAIELCDLGEHDAAEAALEGACPRPIEHPFPWTVDSRPSGATVLFRGEEKVTPFEIESGFGERIDLEFSYEGCEPNTLSVTRPANSIVYLHRHPERHWENQDRIESAPVAIGDDHVIADRRGRVVRLDAESRTEWEIELSTLGGVARTPIFLPEKPGQMLLLTEDGHAWLIDAATGETEGPRDVGSPPRKGPTLTRSGVTASFADGRLAVWTDGLEPTFYKPDGIVSAPIEPDPADDNNATLAVMRNAVGQESVLESPWTRWTASVEPDAIRIVGPDGLGFTAARRGGWSYVAWERPKALLPLGRLWIADGQGVRAYVPREGDLTPLGPR